MMNISDIVECVTRKPKAVCGIATFGLLMASTSLHGATVTKSTMNEVGNDRGSVPFSARIGAGYLSGQAHEYVYWADEGGHTASELVWDIDSAYMFGIGGSIRPLDWLNINADIWVNLGDGEGYMVDYDWMVVGMDWTDQSVHDDTDVTQAFIFDVNVEMTMLESDTVALFGIAGYRHDAFEWEARGGSYVYSVNGFRDSTGNFPNNMLGITYEQKFNVPYLGIGFNADIDRFHIAAKVIGSIFVNGEAIDHHHARNLVTYDDFSGESMLAFDIALGYDITDAIALLAEFSYEKYDTMQGDSEWHFNDVGAVYTLKDGAGADLETTMFSLNMVYNF